MQYTLYTLSVSVVSNFIGRNPVGSEQVNVRFVAMPHTVLQYSEWCRRRLVVEYTMVGTHGGALALCTGHGLVQKWCQNVGPRRPRKDWQVMWRQTNEIYVSNLLIIAFEKLAHEKLFRTYESPGYSLPLPATTQTRTICERQNFSLKISLARIL